MECSILNRLVSACLAVTGAVVSASAADSELPGLDFDQATSLGATGYFRIANDSYGGWCFVTPGGHGFFMAGNNGPDEPTGDWCPALKGSPYRQAVKSKYADDRAWADESVRRLLSWKFNTINAWIRPPNDNLMRRGLAWTMVVQFGKGFAGRKDISDANLFGESTYRFPNVFSAAYPRHCRELAQRSCEPHREDPWLIGWYIDNELCWNGDVPWTVEGRDGTGIYDAVSKLSDGHSARRGLEAFLMSRGLKDGRGVSDDVKRDFLREVARRYFDITISAVRAVDPNHLILGCRFAGANSMCDVVWEETGRACDAVSVNWYPSVNLTNQYVRANWQRPRPSWDERVDELFALTRKPLIVTEWAYRGKDVGLGNTKGAGQKLETQAERAAASELYMRKMISRREVVGYAHFKWLDEPKLGRFDGEDSNYGLVNEQDVPYRELTAAFARVQGRLYALRRELTTTGGRNNNEK